ncbi:CNNM domain-containing protein [Nostoc sp.]|uniref:CNNM domain-containing protein n=1 Tax=Nostoc sp. TaxID=1180 RepID=UPI002FEEB6C6
MNSPLTWLTAGKLLSVIFLVLANGFFVAAEFALVALRRSRVEQLVIQGHPGAKALQRAVNNLDAYLAATQLGVTISSLGLQL